jgi:6-phosphogluconolactonase (cycloisomerase 2 family)
VTGSPFGDATELLVEHPSGNFLYVEGSAGIEVLSVGSDGELTQTSALSAPPITDRFMVLISPSGEHAYLASERDPNTGLTTINVYAVNQQDGSLTFQSSTDTASDFRAIVMHPSGNSLYAYVCGDILKFPVDSAGNLQTPTTTTNVSACDMVFDKTGNFAFVNQGDTILGMFSVDPMSGELMGIDNTPPFSENGHPMYLIE